MTRSCSTNERSKKTAYGCLFCVIQIGIVIADSGVNGAIILIWTIVAIVVVTAVGIGALVNHWVAKQNGEG
ncbi:MAG: hypothetical protein K0R47_3362 [Brevibacillus sp.]|nr:hypothetical protein [Brevibacillus sp.]